MIQEYELAISALQELHDALDEKEEELYIPKPDWWKPGMPLGEEYYSPPEYWKASFNTRKVAQMIVWLKNRRKKEEEGE
jgi:hypothetical protein